jgi:hypothetical protein
LAAYHASTTIAEYIHVCAVICLVVIMLMPELRNQDISVEREEAPSGTRRRWGSIQPTTAT